MLKKISTILFSFVVSIFFYILLTLYDQQEKLLFKSIPLEETYQFSSRYPFKEIHIKAPDGGIVNALHFTASQTPSEYLVIYFHGRGGNLSTDWGQAPYTFLERKYDVLIMDYRTFGKSRGPLSEKALLQDTDLIYDYACERYRSKNIILYGRSLGTGFAAYVASKHPARMLILEAPYYSMIDLACRKLSYVPKPFLSFLLKYHLTTFDWIKKAHMPVEIFHGTNDGLIPLENSLRLSQVDHKVRLNILDQATHHDLISHGTYKEKIDALLPVPQHQSK